MTQEFVTLPREVMEQALKALENTSPLGFNMESDKKFYAAIVALRSALEQPQVQQEPVAGVVIRDGLPCLLQDRHIKSTDHRVYTHPQPAQKPLTDDQVLKAVRHLYQSDLPVGMGFSDDLDVARAVLEAAPQPQTTEQSSAVQSQVERVPYLWYDPENGDTWTQEAVDEGFCATDSLIPLYTK